MKNLKRLNAANGDIVIGLKRILKEPGSLLALYALLEFVYDSQMTSALTQMPFATLVVFLMSVWSRSDAFPIEVKL